MGCPISMDVSRKRAGQGYRLTEQIGRRLRSCQSETLAWHDIGPNTLPGLPGEHVEEDVVFCQQPSHTARSIDADWLKFPEKQKPEHLIQVASGQHRAGDGTVTRYARRRADFCHAAAGPGMQFRSILNLRAQIGGSI